MRQIWLCNVSYLCCCFWCQASPSFLMRYLGFTGKSMNTKRVKFTESFTFQQKARMHRNCCLHQKSHVHVRQSKSSSEDEAVLLALRHVWACFVQSCNLWWFINKTYNIIFLSWNWESMSWREKINKFIITKLLLGKKNKKQNQLSR